MPTTVIDQPTCNCDEQPICHHCEQPACLDHHDNVTTCVDRLGVPEPMHTDCHRDTCRSAECWADRD